MSETKGPKGSWLFGVGAEYGKGPLKFFMKTAREYPGIASFRITHRRMHILSSPDFIKHVLVTNNKNYRKGLKYDELKYFLGNSLASSEGDFWRKQRRMAQPSFSRQKIASFMQTMLDYTTETIDKWEKEERTTLEMNKEMQELSLGIVGRTLFNKDIIREFKEIGDYITFAMSVVNNRIQTTFNKPMWLPTPTHLKFKKAKKVLDKFFYQLIEERKKNTFDTPDLLSMLMDAYDEDTGEKMSNVQLRDEIAAIIVGGQESTALGLGWVMYLLSQNKEVEQKLCEEIERVTGGNEITIEHVPQLSYTMQIVKESLRLYPPFWIFARKALDDDLLGDREIKKGDNILISSYVVHRSEKYWKDPEVFDPERFSVENSKNIKKHAYIPFGAGPRLCIGNNFALLEMQIVIAKIYQRYTLTPVGNSGKEIKATISLGAKDGLYMNLIKR